MFELSVKVYISEVGKRKALQKYYRDYKHGIITEEFCIVRRLTIVE